MATFIGGPADGVSISFRRPAICLRVVGPPWDVLDQLDDEARPEEGVYFYLMNHGSNLVHVRREKKSGFEVWGTYSYVENQPPEEIMRDNTIWRRWVDENAERLMRMRK